MLTFRTHAFGHQHMTYHAFVRYCERGVGMDLSPYRQAPHTTDVSVVHAMIDEGIDIQKIAIGFMTPRFIAGMKAGATQIKVNGLIFKMDGGSIVTVLYEKRRRRERQGKIPRVRKSITGRARQSRQPRNVYVDEMAD